MATTKLLDFLEPAIKQRLRDELEVVFEEMKKDMILRMERKKEEIIYAIAIDLMSTVDITTASNRLVITVNKIQNTLVPSFGKTSLLKRRGRPKKK